MARYIIRAYDHGDKVEFLEPLTLTAALDKAAELKAAHFQHITLVNTHTGLEITDLEELTGGSASAGIPHNGR